MNAAPDQRWRMAGLAFVTQNCATGLTFGAFGVILLTMEAKFETTRTLASLGLSLAIVTLSLVAPVLGSALTRRISIRTAMLAGICLGALGYGLLTIAPNIYVVLAIYTFIIGPSLVLFGNLPSNTLVATWFGERAGKALGLVNMPLLVTLTPLAAAAILNKAGLNAVFLSIAAVHLLILPLAAMVKDGPFARSRGPLEAAPPERVLTRRLFWALAIATGIVSGAGVMKISHLAAIVIGQGYGQDLAVNLLAASGAAGLLGSPMFGWMADRIGGLRAMVVNALIQAAAFSILLAPVGEIALYIDAIAMGACGAGVVAAQGVAFAHLFGPKQYGRVLGLMSLVTIPFVFGLTPMASFLFDHYQTYSAPIGVIVALLLASAAIYAILYVLDRRNAPAANAGELQ
jgi:MFS family permease